MPGGGPAPGGEEPGFVGVGASLRHPQVLAHRVHATVDHGHPLVADDRRSLERETPQGVPRSRRGRRTGQFRVAACRAALAASWAVRPAGFFVKLDFGAPASRRCVISLPLKGSRTGGGGSFGAKSEAATSGTLSAGGGAGGQSVSDTVGQTP